MATDLERIFEGEWVGEGEIVGCGLLRRLLPKEPFRLSVRFERLSTSTVVARDRLEFGRGGTIERTMYLERTGERRWHATADDMPLGAHVDMTAGGYRYAPYWSWTALRGRRLFLRAREEGTFLPDGTLECRIRVAWHGIPLANNRFVLRRG